MNLNHFNSFLDYQAVDTGNALVYYDFTTFSGSYLQNELHTGMLEESCVNPSNYPGLVSCISTGDFFSENGSGYFDGEATLQVGTGIDLSEFTIFVNFNYEKHSTGVPNVLMSTIGSGFSNSGFYVYVNDANRLSVEFYAAGEPRCNTLNYELGNKNIISISKTKNNSTMNLTYHDVLERSNHTLTFAPNNLADSRDLVFGNLGFNDASATGISGYIDNIAILNSYIPVAKRNEIAKSFVSTGLNFGQVSVTTESFNSITDISVENQITGTGITGYENIGSASFDLKCGSVNLCNLSGVTGALSGDVFSVTTGSQVSVSEQSFQTVTVDYDDSYMTLFGSNCVLFLDSERVDSQDIFEMYYYTGFNQNVNVVPTYVASNDSYRLGVDYEGQNINLYFNGLAQQSGERDGSDVVYDFSILDIDIDSDSFFDDFETLIYDKVSGSSIFTGITTEDASSIVMEILGEDLSQKDVFYNGQKLLSGIDYREHPTFGSDTVEFFLSGHGTGDIYFLARPTSFTRETGDGFTAKTFSEKTISPQLWVNGVRQKRGLDFDLFRSDSLIFNENQFEIFETTIYNNSENFFDT